jgi:hypothetical protein
MSKEKDQKSKTKDLNLPRIKHIKSNQKEKKKVGLDDLFKSGSVSLNNTIKMVNNKKNKNEIKSNFYSNL